MNTHLGGGKLGSTPLSARPFRPEAHLKSHWRHLSPKRSWADKRLPDTSWRSAQKLIWCRRASHGRGAAIGMGWSGHCAVVNCESQAQPLPNCTASGEDASCTISNVAMTQGKGIIRDHRPAAQREKKSKSRTLHLSHTFTGPASHPGSVQSFLSQP